jgi:hypothetical protein
MVQITPFRQLRISIAYPQQAPQIALFMDYPRIADVNTLADITIAWARANLLEGERMSSYVGALANLAVEDVYLFRKWMLDLLAEAEVDTHILYVDISHELEDNSWYRWLNGLKQNSFGTDDGYSMHFEPRKNLLAKGSSTTALDGQAEQSSKRAIEILRAQAALYR